MDSCPQTQVTDTGPNVEFILQDLWLKEKEIPGFGIEFGFGSFTFYTLILQANSTFGPVWKDHKTIATQNIMCLL